MVLGGVAFDAPVGPVSHSDGDAIIHAVVDAVLGALGLPDLGRRWPDTDPALEGADSATFLEALAPDLQRAGLAVGNLDVTVIAEAPRIAPRADDIAKNLARLLGCPLDRVNVKGTTREGLGDVGAGRAVEAHAVVLLAPAGGNGDPVEPSNP